MTATNDDLTEVPAIVLGTTELRTPSAAAGMSFSRDGLMAVGSAREIRIFERTKRRLVSRISFPSYGNLPGPFSLSGRRLMILPVDGKTYRAHVYDTQTGQPIIKATGASLGFLGDDRVVTLKAPKYDFGLDLSLRELEGAVLRVTARDGVQTEVKLESAYLRGLVTNDDRHVVVATSKGLDVRNSDTLELERTLKFPNMASLRLFRIGGTNDLLLLNGEEMFRSDLEGNVAWRHRLDTPRPLFALHPTRPLSAFRSRDSSVRKASWLSLDTCREVRALSPPHSYLFTLTVTGELASLDRHANTPRFFDSATGNETGDSSPRRSARRLLFRPGSHELVSIGGRMHVWGTEESRLEPRRTWTTDGPFAAFVPNTSVVLSIQGDKLLRRDIADGKSGDSSLKDLDPHADEKWGFSWFGGVSADGESVAYVDRHRAARVVSLPAMKPEFQQLAEVTGKDLFSGTKNYRGYHGISFRPDTTEVVLLSDGHLSFFDLSKKRPVRRVLELDGSADAGLGYPALRFLSKDQVLVRAYGDVDTHDSRLVAMDCNNGRTLFEIFNTGERLDDFTVSPNGRYIVVTGKAHEKRPDDQSGDAQVRGLLRIIDARNGQTAARFVHPDVRSIPAVDVSDDGQLLAVSCSDTTIRVHKFDDLLP